MLGEIDKDFYCSIITHGNGNCSAFGDDSCGKNCKQRHRKHPTPKQFKDEYGKEYSADGAVYILHYFGEGYNETRAWLIDSYKNAVNFGAVRQIVCAVTPFGKPDDDWRPE